MESDGGTGPDLFGLSVEDAVAELAEDDDRERLRATLERVATDGVVSREGLDDALGHVSKVVATPETRLELAGDTLEEAREDAEDVADIDAVENRIAAFEKRYADVADRLETVQTDLQSVVARADDPDDVYALATSIVELEAAANDVQRAADELAVDIEEFQRWLADAERRHREFDEDVEALERAVAELTDEDVTDADAWLDATLRRRALALLLADLRAERADLDALADRAGAPPLEGFSERLDALEDRLATVETDLEEAARPAWRRRHGDRIAAFEEGIADLSPPVPWAAVWERYEESAPATE